jgi:type VI secretion system protein
MGRELMLLDRIARVGERAGGRFESAGENLDALMDSVRRQLVRLFNSRHGLSEAQPDYGLPALTDLVVGSGDYVQAVQRAIQTAVEKYEPRLRRVRVSRVEDEHNKRTLTFRVEATLIARTGEHRVCYETSMSGEGQFDVSD